LKVVNLVDCYPDCADTELKNSFTQRVTAPFCSSIPSLHRRLWLSYLSQPHNTRICQCLRQINTNKIPHKIIPRPLLLGIGTCRGKAIRTTTHRLLRPALCRLFHEVVVIFFFFLVSWCGGETESTWYVGHYLTYFTSPG
jgi:hypothetical protein